jgi:hypothetical protein
MRRAPTIVSTIRAGRATTGSLEFTPAPSQSEKQMMDRRAVRIAPLNPRWRARGARWDALAAIVAICALAGGCASSRDQPAAGTPAFAPQAGPDITRVASQTFDLAEIAPTGRPAVQVRLETPAQVGEAGGFGLAGGVGRTVGTAVTGAAYGLVNPVVGGLLVIASPALIVAGAIYDANVKRVSSVLVAFDLPARLQAELAERLAATRPGAEESRVVIEVAVAGYGFMAPASENASGPSCFTFAAELAVRDGERTLFNDQIFEEPFRRSLDVPPPRCASMAELADHDGQLAREVLEESSRVIAAVIAKRLKVAR